MGTSDSAAKVLRSGGRLFAAGCLWLILCSSATSAQNTEEKAWEILQSGLRESSTSKRAAAVGALGLLQGEPRAIEAVEKALGDKRTTVRAAAATTLGQLGARSSIPLLKEALADKENRVFYAAADALLILGDPAGYDPYYEVLVGERRIGEGWFTDKKRLLADPRAMTLLGVGVGIGYAPYATYGWMVWREFSKDYATPMRVKALNKLANDPDTRIGEALVEAASDKHWTVRVAALSAIARHGDPTLISAITSHMTDQKPAVRYTAAAAVLRLWALTPIEEMRQQSTDGHQEESPDHEHKPSPDP